MTDIWEDRKKALENEYIHRKEQEAFAKMKQTVTAKACLGHCPKCGKIIEPITFHGVPLDKCPGCGGVWLGLNDLKILAAKDHRTWFDKWFHNDEETTMDREV